MPLVGGDTSGMLSRLGDRTEGGREGRKKGRGEVEKRGGRERGEVEKRGGREEGEGGREGN